MDIDECIADKPCDQMCHNTDGSFYCTCRLGFVLQSDRQSCRKIDLVFGRDDTGTAFEARDLENDLDNDDLATRMHNIEKVKIEYALRLPYKFFILGDDLRKRTKPRSQ